MSRGPIVYSYLSCAYGGSDTIQCSARQRDTGYCAAPGERDVTATTEWLTSNPAAAIFVSPGLLKVTGSGQVQVTAKLGGFGGVDGDYVYVVAPGTTPERLIKLSVILRDAANTEIRLRDAAIEVMPDRGALQSCRSSGTGHCEFWVFDGRISVRATLQGYEPAEGVAVKPFPDLFAQQATLDLKAIR